MNDKPLKIVNLFAGPGTGKSTTAAALFAELKYRGINCEYVSEYAKDAAWEKRGKKFFRAQQLIWGKQSFRFDRLRDEVEVAITDSPLLLGLIYMPEDFAIPSLRKAILEDHARYDTLNVILRRNKPYNPKGRNQTEEEAKAIDPLIWNMMGEHQIPHHGLNFGRSNVEEIVRLMQQRWSEDIPALMRV